MSRESDLSQQTKVQVGYRLVGEFTDEGEVPTDLVFHQGEVVRPHPVVSFLDLWSQDEGSKDRSDRKIA